jgi:hypothetical protein
MSWVPGMMVIPVVGPAWGKTGTKTTERRKYQEQKKNILMKWIPTAHV